MHAIERKVSSNGIPLIVFHLSRNDLSNIKDNLATLTVYQKNLDNNVNQKLAAIKVSSVPKLLTRLNQFPKNTRTLSNDATMGEAHEEDENAGTDIVSSYRREINYGNGAEYTAAPPLPNLPYGANDYDYSIVNNKKYVVYMLVFSISYAAGV